MKVVINTQYRENYGDVDNAYWKFKGGCTYIISDLTPAQAQKAVATGCPNLKVLIERFTPMFEEYVVGISVHDDADKVCEDWETPVFLTYINGQWDALEVETNDEYGYMNPKIERVTRNYFLAPAGERTDYRCYYYLRNGEVVASDRINEVLTIG